VTASYRRGVDRQQPTSRVSHAADVVDGECDQRGSDGPGSASQKGVVRAVIVDDHELVRDGIRTVLEAEPDIDVVGEAGTVAEAVARIALAQPAVAIVDLALPDGTGVEVCRAVRERSPGTRVMILTSYDDDEALFDAVIGGAAGYVLKSVRGPQLVECVRRVARGEALLDRAASARMKARIKEAGRHPVLGELSAQERKVLALVADGLTNRDIASRLCLSEKTIKNYVSRLLMKLGMSRRSEAAAFAARIDSRRQAVLSSAMTSRTIRY
jgi:two-component system, NarL family, response regulator DevR